MSVSGNSGGSVRRGDENRPCRPGLAGTRLLRTVEGHAGPALYSTTAIKGYFPLREAEYA